MGLVEDGSGHNQTKLNSEVNLPEQKETSKLSGWRPTKCFLLFQKRSGRKVTFLKRL